MFVRTKDGNIYSVAKVRDDILVNTEKGIIRKVGYVVNELPISKCIINEEDIISKADTIWELCDGFYIDDGSGDFKKENIFETILEFENVYHKKRISDTYAIGYGFIKTDKGLIFVSEFKDKDMVLI